MARADRMPWWRSLLLLLLALSLGSTAYAVDARFDLVGPKIDVRITRGTETLPIAEVPNLQPGDKLWLHPDLPPSQSVKYLLICAFLRGSTNPPPEEWFIRIETWQKNVRQEGVFITVPQEAEQAVLFLAPETGGDFSTLKSAVRGRPGVFVRATQDLNEAGFEQARIERYLADIRRVQPTDAADLQKHSDLLARTLNLKPNPDCFKQAVDRQFTCLTQTGTQTLLDDGHSTNVISALSSGQTSDFINQASYVQAAGAGLYSAYVGAIVDLLRIMGSIHTAQFQYIPAIAFPQKEALNLRLNTPPSFHNPKSVIVIGLPAVQSAQAPPLRSADPNSIACLLRPTVTLPIEGAPLVFSTAFAHELVLHLNTPAGAPAEPDIPLVPDAYQGGLVLQRNAPTRRELARQPLSTDIKPVQMSPSVALPPKPTSPERPEPVTLTGTIRGRWGFDSFTGPELRLQQLPGTDWRPTSTTGNSPEVIAGYTTELLLVSSGSACVHTIEATPPGSTTSLSLTFHPVGDHEHPNLLAVTLPASTAIAAGDLHLAIQQYGQPSPDGLSTRTFSEPAHVLGIELRASDRTLRLTGTSLSTVERIQVGDLIFRPALAANDSTASANSHVPESQRFNLPENAPSPPTHTGDKLNARLLLTDGRTVNVPIIVGSARPDLRLLSKSVQLEPGASPIALGSSDDIPLTAQLTFTLKTRQPFPRSGQIEIETLDGALRAVLTFAPSGGLVLQDPRTLVATLDPLRSFGPSAFGALHVRAIYPPAAESAQPPVSERASNGGADKPFESSTTITSDWLPLATLVRLPALRELQCPPDFSQSCTVTGQNLFLIQSVSVDPTFTSSALVPDGFTGTTLPVPHPTGTILYLKLRDDPEPVDTAFLPVQPGAAPNHHHGRPSAVNNPPPPQPALTTAAGDAVGNTAPSPSSSTSPHLH